MSVFAHIETQLRKFAAEQHAVLTRDRENYGLPNFFGFEERRIGWQRDDINLAVIIQPDFLETGVDTTKWNFRLVAWQDIGYQKCTADQDLATSVPFQYIEEQIEGLLAEARTYLDRIRASDLRCWDDFR